MMKYVAYVKLSKYFFKLLIRFLNDSLFVNIFNNNIKKKVDPSIYYYHGIYYILP